MKFDPCSEWPSPSGIAPDGIDGWETGTAAYAEWERHLDRVLPEFAVHDLARQLAGSAVRTDLVRPGSSPHRGRWSQGGFFVVVASLTGFITQ